MDLFIKKLTRNELGLTGAKTHGEIYVPMNGLDFFPRLSDGPRPECSLKIVHRSHQAEHAFQQFLAFVTVYEKGEAHLRRMKPLLGPHVQPGDFLALRKLPDTSFEASIIRQDSMFAAILETLLGNDVAKVLTEKDAASVTSSSGATFDSLMESSQRLPESPTGSRSSTGGDQHVIKDHPLTNGTPPEWASEWGHDEFGPWCSFDVDGIQQVLRWIPPGQFQMGVAEEYEGLFDEYGPRHWVTLTRGFWMFETKCSTELYNRLMRTSKKTDTASLNPAVGMNIWEAQRFCSLLSEHLGMVSVSLPTDAQWEFACRAGRQDGPHFDLDFDKVDGPNPWGLRSMLSGTGEFCSGGRRLYSDKAVVDPLGDEEAAVIRGLPRSIPGVLRDNSQSAIDEKPANHFERKTHPSFRNVVDSNSPMPDVGFRCIIAEENWQPAARPEVRHLEDLQSSDNSSNQDPTEPKRSNSTTRRSPF